MKRILMNSTPRGWVDVTEHDRGGDRIGNCYVHRTLPLAICTEDGGDEPQLSRVEWENESEQRKRTHPTEFNHLLGEAELEAVFAANPRLQGLLDAALDAEKLLQSLHAEVVDRTDKPPKWHGDLKRLSMATNDVLYEGRKPFTGKSVRYQAGSPKLVEHLRDDTSGTGPDDLFVFVCENTGWYYTQLKDGSFTAHVERSEWKVATEAEIIRLLQEHYFE